MEAMTLLCAQRAGLPGSHRMDGQGEGVSWPPGAGSRGGEGSQLSPPLPVLVPAAWGWAGSATRP